MNLQIINEPLRLNMHGFSAAAINKDYCGMAFKLMDRMWQAVKSNGLPNKGLNIWVFSQDEMVFSGVELEAVPNQSTGLEQQDITLPKYAYYKHIGPYNLISQKGKDMREELRNNGYETVWPYIEIYGHWNNDETKLETELLMALK